MNSLTRLQLSLMTALINGLSGDKEVEVSQDNKITISYKDNIGILWTYTIYKDGTIHKF